MVPQVLTGYGLQSGLVVWLTPSNYWSSDISSARVACTEKDLAEMKEQGCQAQQAHQIFEIYAVEVSLGADGPVPIKYREFLRSRGPTVHPQFGPQSQTE